MQTRDDADCRHTVYKPAFGGDDDHIQCSYPLFPLGAAYLTLSSALK